MTVLARKKASTYQTAGYKKPCTQPMGFVDDIVQSYEMVYALMSFLWYEKTIRTHQCIHNINVIVSSEMSFSCTKCDYSSCISEMLSCTKGDYSSCINNTESKRDVITSKVYLLVSNSSTYGQLNIQVKVHYNCVCMNIYSMYMRHMIGLFCSEYKYKPGILSKESQYITIISLTRIIVCIKLNTMWEIGYLIIYISKWRYKIM